MFTSITGEMLSGVLTEVTGLVPIVAPAVIGFIAFRKGWSFLKSSIKGA